MTKRKIQGGWFDPEVHEYTNESGIFVPSSTQVLSLVRYSDFRGINPAVVENAARRGHGAHYLTQVFDEDDELPPPWSEEDEMIRFEGYRRWKEKENFIPESVEYPLISSVYGMEFGCTIDRIGLLRSRKAIVELKFTYGPSKSWGIQTASQEIALTGSRTLGRYLRMAVHVDKKGKAAEHIYTDAYDAQRFICALGVVYARIDLGQDIRSEALRLED